MTEKGDIKEGHPQGYDSQYRLQLNEINPTTKVPTPKADYMNSVAEVEISPQEIKEEKKLACNFFNSTFRRASNRGNLSSGFHGFLKQR